MHNDYYIYCYFHPYTGQPCYIGKGRRHRWKQHLNNSSNPRLMNIIKKYGRDNVPFVKLHIGLTHIQSNEYESVLIKAIGRYPSGPLVNMTDGGDGTTGWVPTQEQRANISAERLKRPNLYQIMAKASAASRSPKAIAKRINKIRGRKASPETRAKMSASWKDRKPYTPERNRKVSEGLKGRKTSQETKDKIAASLRGRELPPNHPFKGGKGFLGRKHSPETLVKLRNRKPSPETLVKLRVPKSPEHIAKIILTKSRRRAERLAVQTLTVTTPENDHQSTGI